MMSSTAFSSSNDALLRKVDCIAQVTQDEDLFETYEIHYSIKWLLQHCYTNIALQFPDELLTDAPKVAQHIQKALTNSFVFILGDTSYGSCCVDEVGAQHYKADCIIHYGHACLSPTTRLPILYVFCKSSVNVNKCISKIQQSYTESSKETVLVYDVSYAHIIEKVYRELQNCLPHVTLSLLHITGKASTNSYFSTIVAECAECDQKSQSPRNLHDSFIQKCGRTIHLPEGVSIHNCNIIFLGSPESLTLVNLMMTFNKSSFFIYDPQTETFEPTNVNVNKTLMKRYYLIERAKDANIIGIVVGTLGVERYIEVIDHLKVLIKNSGKKSYTFVTGKLNPAKLANFAEVDIYVLVSCLESSLIESKEFYRPVVTPFEMEMACNRARVWNGEYTTEFASILPGSSMYLESPKDSENVEEGDVSLITNRIRILGKKGSTESSEKDVKSLVKASNTVAISGAAKNAGEFFSMRSWKGLEKELGNVPVVKATEGQKGIAASYDHETPQSVIE